MESKQALHIVSITQTINDKMNNSFLAFKHKQHALDFFADKFFYYSELIETIETTLDKKSLRFTCVFNESNDVQVEVVRCRYMEHPTIYNTANFNNL